MNTALGFHTGKRHVGDPGIDRPSVHGTPNPDHRLKSPIAGQETYRVLSNAIRLHDERYDGGLTHLVGHGRRHGREMKALWTDLVRRPHIADALGPEFRLDGRYMAWPIPARIDEVELTSGRVLFVGDAAAATDVMTGEGIGQALLTGRLAAQAIHAAGALQPSAAADLYRGDVGHHLFADHAMSKALGSVLARSWGARGVIRVVDHSGSWGRRNFARWMFEDEPRAVVLTPSRWHRGFLSRPGAYAS